MALGSPKGNHDPVGSLLVVPRESQVLQVAGEEGDGFFFLAHQSCHFFFFVKLPSFGGGVWRGSFRLGNKKVSGSGCLPLWARVSAQALTRGE